MKSVGCRTNNGEWNTSGRLITSRELACGVSGVYSVLVFDVERTTPMTREQEEQAERLAIAHNDRLVREKAAEDRRASTFLAMAIADSELPGRFGKVTQQHIVGTTPGPIYPPLPANIPWPEGRDELGYAIDDQEIVGSPAEIEAAQRILEQRSAADTADGDADDVPVVPSAAVEQLSASPIHSSAFAPPLASTTGPATSLSAPTDDVAGPTSLRRRL
jgi:hypothetical protein